MKLSGQAKWFMKKQAEEWLKAAADDLKVVEKIQHDESLTNMIAFHAQQAIEKTLKGILEEFESRVPRIHNLIKLKDLTEKYIELEIDKLSIERLNEIYTDTRYPSDLGLIPDGKPSLKLAKTFYATAIEVYDVVAKKIL